MPCAACLPPHATAAGDGVYVPPRAGPKGEGGLDDASGGNGGSGGASMKQSSGAVDLGACILSIICVRAAFGLNMQRRAICAVQYHERLCITLHRKHGPRRRGHCMGTWQRIQVSVAERRIASKGSCCCPACSSESMIGNRSSSVNLYYDMCILSTAWFALRILHGIVSSFRRSCASYRWQPENP